MDTAMRPAYETLKALIDEIDEKLDSLEDSGSATGRRIINELIKEREENVEAAAQQLISQLASNFTGDDLIAYFHGILNRVEKHFKEDVGKLVDAKVEAAPKSEPLITAEEAEVLSKQRSELYQQIKMAVTLAKTMDNVDLEMPKTRRGSRGKRGVRAMSLMVWAINGTELDPQPKYKELAVQVGFESGKDLTAFLKSKNINTTNPEGDKLEVELADGRILTGYIPEGAREKAAETPAEDNSADDDDDDDESTEDTSAE